MGFRHRQPHQVTQVADLSLSMKSNLERVGTLILMDHLDLCSVSMTNTFLKNHIGKPLKSLVFVYVVSSLWLLE